jgi:glycosyltransferase involved in cell wall biosynthesis
MRFSIITITFNSEKFLSETLESVVNQDFSDYEHIIWDGGSTDRTLEIARNFPHVKIFEGSDMGISDAMNKGSLLGKGEFLLHLHSDDLLDHSKSLSQVDSFLRQHPNATWVYGQAKIINATGDTLRTTDFIPFSHKRLRKYNIITHPSTFISRKLFIQAGGFQTDLRYCMDYDLWLRLAEIAPPLPLPAVISQFREHSNSLSSSEGLHVTNEAYKVRNKYVKNLWERFRSYRTWKKRRKRFQ